VGEVNFYFINYLFSNCNRRQKQQTTIETHNKKQSQGTDML